MKKQRRGTRTQDAIPDILDRVSRGESLRRACAAHGLDASGFCQRVREDDALAQQYARAKEIGLEMLAEELVDIADTPCEGTETTVKQDGGVEVKTGDMLGHRKLQIDTRKWLLSKLLPKKYGDRMLHGSDPDNPLPAPVQLNVPR